MSKSPLPGTKTLLMGAPGTGKTHVLRTLINAGLHPLCIFTENSFDVLGDVPADKLSWVYIPPTREGLADLRKQVADIGSKTYQALTNVYDADRGKDAPLDKVLQSMMEFKDARMGSNFGNISSWGTGIVFVIDSLSGLSKASWQNVAGTRVALSPADYGLAQKQIENLLTQICTNFRCHVVVTAHAEKEMDPVFGGTKIMPSLPGKALAPVVGRYFTDVILTKWNGKDYVWDTADPAAELKARNLPRKADQPASFVPLIEAWKKRGGIIETIVT